MNSKKLNIFAFVMVFILCGISIFLGITARQNKGLSSYELAIKNGIISSSMTELEYLESLQGKNGSNVSVEDIYKEYLKVNNLTEKDLSYKQFITTYFPDKIMSESETVGKIENATQTALRSTVDICYSYYMDTETIYVNEGKTSTGESIYLIDETKTGLAEANAAAGSGVIYQMNDTTAYIITNYHVVYIDNYTNNNSYRVYANETTGSYFTATYDESLIETYQTKSALFSGIKKSSITKAPIETHFLNSYGIYVYGYQSEQYEIQATFVGGSADNDIAVLKVEKNGGANNALLFNGTYKVADIESSDSLREGQTVIAVGNPLLPSGIEDKNYSAKEFADAAKKAYVESLVLTSTSGEISNISENCIFESIIESGLANKMRLMRVSAAINSGNSGGGLYNTEGKLVGIVNGKIANEKYDNVGYVIPNEVAIRLADQIIAQCNGTKTRVQVISSDSLGFETENGKSNSYYDADSLGFITTYSVVTKNVTGSLSLAGIKNGDIIKSITVNGKTYSINNFYNVDDILLMAKPNSGSITLNISRYETGSFNSYSKTISYNQSNFREVI